MHSSTVAVSSGYQGRRRLGREPSVADVDVGRRSGDDISTSMQHFRHKLTEDEVGRGTQRHRDRSPVRIDFRLRSRLIRRTALQSAAERPTQIFVRPCGIEHDLTSLTKARLVGARTCAPSFAAASAAGHKLPRHRQVLRAPLSTAMAARTRTRAAQPERAILRLHDHRTNQSRTVGLPVGSRSCTDQRGVSPWRAVALHAIAPIRR